MALIEEIILRNTVEDNASAALDAGAEAADRFDGAMTRVGQTARRAASAVNDSTGRILEASPAYEKMAARVDEVSRLEARLARLLDSHTTLQEQLRREVERGSVSQEEANRVLTSSAQRVEQLGASLGKARFEAEAHRTALAAQNGTLGASHDAMRGLAEAAAAQAQAQGMARRAAEESARAMAETAAAVASATRAQAAYNGVLGVRTDFSGAHRAADIAAYGSELDRLRARFNPLFAASRQYEDVLNEIERAEKIGALSAIEAAAARDRETAAFQRAHGAMDNAVQMHGHLSESSGAASAAMRGLSIQAIQTVSGLATGQPVMMTLIQQGHQVADQMIATGASFSGLATAGRAAFAAIGGLPAVAVAAMVAGVAAIGMSAEKSGRQLLDLQETLRATRADYASAGAAVDAVSRSMAAQGLGSLSDMRTASSTIAAVPTVAVGDLGGYVRQARDLARVMGQDVPTAASLLAQALQDPAAAARRLADAHQLGINPALAHTIELLQASGEASAASALLTRRMGEAARGAAADLTPLQQAVERLSGSYHSGTSAVGEFARSTGDSITWLASAAIDGLTSVMGLLDRGAASMQALWNTIPEPMRRALGRAYEGAENPLSLFGYTGASSGSTSGSLTDTLAASARQRGFSTSELDLAQRIMRIESGGQQYGRGGDVLTSGAGALGAFQIMPGTGARYGFSAQQLASPGSNVDAGLTIIADLWRRYDGDPALVAIAYNGGTGLADAIHDGRSTFADLPQETQQYVKKLAAPVRAADQVAASQRTIDQAYTSAGGTLYAQRQDIIASITLDAKAIREANTAFAEGRMSQDQYAETTGRLNVHLHQQQVALENLRSPAEETIHSLREQAEQSGALAGASRDLLQIRQQLTSQGASQAEIDAATAAKQAALGNIFAQNVSVIDRQAHAIRIQADASLAGAAAAEHVANATKAEQQARETAIPGTAEYARQVQILTNSYDTLSAVQRDARNGPAIEAHEQSIALLQRETEVAGLGADAQDRLLSIYRESQAVVAAGMDISQPLAQRRIQLAAAEADARRYRDAMQANFSEISRFGDDLGSTIGTAITAGFANGTISALKFKDVMNAVASAAIQELMKLALINPLKNWLNGKDSGLATLDGVLSSLLGYGGSSSSGRISGGYDMGSLMALGAGVSALVVSGGAGAAPSIGNSVSGAASGAAASAGGTLGAISSVGSAAGGGDFFTILGVGASALKAADSLHLFSSSASAAASAANAAGNAAASAAHTSAGMVGYVSDAVKAAKDGAVNALGTVKDGASSVLGTVGGTLNNATALASGYIASAINMVLYPSAYAAGQALTMAGATGFAGLAGSASATGFAADMGISGAGYLSGAASATSGAANAAGAAGGISASTIAAAIPWISAVVGVAIPLIQGDLEKAGIVAGAAVTGAVIGTWVFPVLGTAVGAALGAMVGSFFGPGPKNPYSQVDILNQDGHLAIGNAHQQVAGKTFDAQRENARAGIDAVNKMLDLFQIKIANTSDVLNNIPGGRVGIVGSGLESSIRAVRTFGELFPYLRFDAANDTSNYTRAAHGQIVGQSYADPNALAADLTAVANFATGLDALGIHLNAMDRNFKNLQIGKADWADSSTFSRGLAGALPGHTYADQTALQQAIQQVYSFTEGTVPALLQATTRPTSAFEKQIADLNKPYAEASGQAQAWGLNDVVQQLADKFAQLSGELFAQQLRGLREADLAVTYRGMAASNGSASSVDAAMSTFDIKAQQQREALKKSWQDVYGDSATAMAEYVQQSVNLERTLSAERLQAQELGNLQLTSSFQQSNVTRVGYISADWRAQARLISANDNSAWGQGATRFLNQGADLIDFDQSSKLQITNYRASLIQLYGTSYAQTSDYASKIAEAEQSLATQRLAIIASYAAQAKEAEKSAQANVAGLINGIGDWATRLAQGDQSVLSPQAKLDLARSQYQAVSGAALAGDYNSAMKFTGYADTYLAAAKAFYGSTADYAAAFSSVTNDALKITQMPPDTLTASAMTAAMKAQTAELVESLGKVQATLQQLLLVTKQGNSGISRIAS
ncbi:phage tail length tape measure family protein [Granulibacter bethesdensis]|uniref:phage tail length tape measure family protein n=1 Tax=Granulibacter bethesdensis TaxID=364410 RepID=UPI00046D2453|nr:phage tail length tape measure family protein [Granulibacter bethesdensis]